MSQWCHWNENKQEANFTDFQLSEIEQNDVDSLKM